jgi:hypothetical protein
MLILHTDLQLFIFADLLLLGTQLTHGKGQEIFSARSKVNCSLIVLKVYVMFATDLLHPYMRILSYGAFQL